MKKPTIPMAVLGAASALALGVNDAPAQTGAKAGVAAAVRGQVQQVSFRTPSATVGRNVSSGDEFERVTGLDLDQALALLRTQGGFEQLWQTISNLMQDQARPGETPPSSPPSPPPPPPPIFN